MRERIQSFPNLCTSSTVFSRLGFVLINYHVFLIAMKPGLSVFGVFPVTSPQLTTIRRILKHFVTLPLMNPHPRPASVQILCASLYNLGCPLRLGRAAPSSASVALDFCLLPHARPWSRTGAPSPVPLVPKSLDVDRPLSPEELEGPPAPPGSINHARVFWFRVGRRNDLFQIFCFLP